MRFKYYLRGAGIGVIVATLVLSIAFLFHDNISDEEVIRRAMKLGMIMQENKPGGTLADPPQSGASSVDLETGTDPADPAQSDDDPLADAQKDPSDGSDPSADPDQNPPDGGDSQSGGDSDPSGTQNDPSSGTDASQKPSGGSDSASADKPSSGDSGSKEDTDKPSKKDPADSKPKDSSDKDNSNKDNSNKDNSDKDEVEIVIASGDVSRMVSAKVFEAGLVDDADEFNSFLGSNDYDNMLQPGIYKIKKGSSFRQIAQILTRQ